MTESDPTSRAPNTKSRPSGGAKLPAAEVRKYPKEILKRVALGILVTLSLMAATKYVETTQIGRDAEKYTFGKLQKLLPSFSENMPVVVVDITKIPGGKDQATSRTALKQTLAAIVAQKPIAVGIDVDFSPDVNGWQTDDDPKFFDFCLQLEAETNVPIYLGVYRTMSETADTWLGSPKYKKLAAALRAENDTMRLPLWIQAKNSDDRLPLMSAALADSYRPTHPDTATHLARTVQVFTSTNEAIEAQGENALLFGESLINFSRLGQIQKETLLMLRPEAIAESGKLFSGKLVLIGDATDSFDQFNIPGHDPPVAGVFLVACAAYTLAAEPLYELNTSARIVLDLLISTVIMVGVELLRARYIRNRPGSRFFKAQSRFIWTVVVSVTVIGLLMTAWLNIMWFDFPLGLFALFLHPRVENRLHGFWKSLRGKSHASHAKE